MAAIMDVEESAILAPQSIPYRDPRRADHLKAYQFQRGNVPRADRTGHIGRPKGMLNAATILERSTPRIAKHYVKRSLQSDPVLIDAMKRILPVAEAGNIPSNTVIVIVSPDAAPRPLSVVADSSPSLPVADTIVPRIADTPDPRR